jgi:nucleotide-binding universal stress UspA family protein
MFQTVVIGVDGSEGSRDALALGEMLAAPAGGRVIAVGVIPSKRHGKRGMPHWGRRVEESAQDTLEAMEKPGVERRVEPARSAAEGLNRVAEEVGADLVVVGPSQRVVVGTRPPGRTALGLLNGAPCAVAVASPGLAGDPDAGLRVIGVAYDASPESEFALSRAVELAQAAGATMRIVAVRGAQPPQDDRMGFGDPQVSQDHQETLRDALQRARDATPQEVRAASELAEGDPATELADAAGRGMDVMFAGSRGYGPVLRVLLGSVTRDLIARAPCPVIVLPRGS